MQFLCKAVVILDRCEEILKSYVGSGVLTMVVMKSSAFWDITPPSSGSKDKPRKIPAWKQVASRALLQDGGDIFL
jgi:hypothetical protein